MPRPGRSALVISPIWIQLALLTFVVGFGILGYLAVRIYAEHPPVPAVTVTQHGERLFTRDDVYEGQLVFEKYGLMEYGTIFGHGAYLGPDFTADYIERAREAMARYYAAHGVTDATTHLVEDFKTNRWDEARDTLELTPAQVAAWHELEPYYASWFGPAGGQSGLRRPTIPPDEMHDLVAYFAWAAWVATANRPGKPYSYTNNWPPAPEVGNTVTADAVLWSTLSLIALLAGIGATLFAFGRFKDLGWPEGVAPGGGSLVFRRPSEVRLIPGQRTTVWFFLIVAALFLLQGLCGGANAHYHAEPANFFGLDVASWFPYNLTRNLAPAARALLCCDGLLGHRDLPRAHDRRQGASPPGQALPLAVRRAGYRRLRVARRRDVELSRPHQVAVDGVVDRGSGLGVSRPRAALAGRPYGGPRSLVDHHGSRSRKKAACRAPRKHAMALLLRVAFHPAFLRRRDAIRAAVRLRGDRLLALLGRPSLGGGLPRDLHHRDGRLHVRAHRHGA